jgi:signal transduction histidine kinase
MKDEFVSVVSHELRTPLTAIHGALSLLNGGYIDPLSERGNQAIKIAADSAERLVRLVNDILELERLQSGKIKLEKTSINIRDLLLHAQAEFEVTATKANITIETIATDMNISADRDRLLQVLTNLLSNAIKFSPPDTKIVLTAHPHQYRTKYSLMPEVDCPYVLFTVKDYGRGIPPGKIEKIFERFQQVDSSDSRQKGGTGLGLAICRNIVEQHGGRIWVKSILERGSKFYFTIPIELIEETTYSKKLS